MSSFGFSLSLNLSNLGKGEGLKNLRASVKRLSSGKKRPEASDGAGHLGLADRFRSQVTRNHKIGEALSNAISYTETQDNILLGISDSILKMSELVAMASDPLKTTSDRDIIETELRKIEDEVNSFKGAKYNGLSVFGSGTINFAPDTLKLAQGYSAFHADSGPHAYYYAGDGVDPNSFDVQSLEATWDEEVPTPESYTLGTGESWITAGAPYVDPNVTITYSFHSSLDGDPLTGVTTAEVKAAVAEALALWSSEADGNLVFVEVADSGPAPDDSTNYDPTGLPVMRFGAHYIDGDGAGVLAHAFYPAANSGLAGDTHFDTGQTWDINLLLETTVHEVGHALGLGHTSNSGIMEPVIQNRYTSGLGSAYLLQDDIDGIRALYAGGTVAEETTDTIYTLESTNFANFSLAGVSATSLASAQSSINTLDSAYVSLLNMRVQVGSSMRELTSKASIYSQQRIGISEALSSVEDISLEDELTAFTAAQLQANAEQSIQAQGIQLSRNLIEGLLT